MQAALLALHEKLAKSLLLSTFWQTVEQTTSIFQQEYDHE
jgi:hypothetical protein